MKKTVDSSKVTTSRSGVKIAFDLHAYYTEVGLNLSHKGTTGEVMKLLSEVDLFQFVAFRSLLTGANKRNMHVRDGQFKLKYY